ncbi:MAG: DNA repair protein RecO [Isosphaeraceae bacterium]|jgi:DNA repair protein RecO (recombination protein O)|nr:MAG: DNA repair protein RecO [Isosphaeraceae bacterium]
MPLVRTRALVLRSVDVFETSRVLTFYSRELGKISALAKGARRLRSPFRSSLDTLSLCDVVLLHKGTEALDLLTEADLVERFDALRRDLATLHAAYYIVELLDGFSEHLAPHPRLHDAAVITLRHLGDPSLRPRRLMRFELACLREFGQLPSWDHCAGCGAPVETISTPIDFNPAAGGRLCPTCRPHHPYTLSLSPHTLSTLRALAEPGDLWRRLNPPPSTWTSVRQTLSALICHNLGRRPRLLDSIEHTLHSENLGKLEKP